MSALITEQTPVQFDDPLEEEVDVVVIGGGIAGVATAYYLAGRGVRVMVCEKGRVAGEQSSRNWGWIRQQGRDFAELPLAMEANRLWRGLAAETGETDLGFTESGCLVLAETQAVMAKCETWIDTARQHQLDTKLLSRTEIRELFPEIKGNWLGGMLTPSDGRGEPFVAVPALARAARRLGARVRENCAVRSLDRQGGAISGVFTEAGRIACSRVVLAGGAWSTHFAANAGINLPQLMIRSTVARTNPAPDAVQQNVWMPGLTLRRRADGGYTTTTGELAEHYLSPASFRYVTKFRKLLAASAKDVRLHAMAPKNYPGAWGMRRRWLGDQETPFEKMRILNPPPNEAVVNGARQRLGERVPALAGVSIAEAWGGMIDVTPDAVPYIGECHTQPGLYLATGLSGHGFGIGPSVGRILADLMTGATVGHDIARFRSNRFTDGSPIVPGPY